MKLQQAEVFAPIFVQGGSALKSLPTMIWLTEATDTSSEQDGSLRMTKIERQHLRLLEAVLFAAAEST